jgi:hypothetical protein
MTRALPRTPLNSSRLTRFLTENAMIDAVPVADDVGQRLGDWLNFRQAIALHAVLHPEPQTASEQPAHQRRVAGMTAEALTRYVGKIRSQLEQSITQGAPSGSGLARIDMPPAELDEPIDPKTAFEPYRRFYVAHQRQMAVTIQTLRAQVRGHLNPSSPRLQQLATLDAAFENILSEREAVLLGKVAKLHERRFAQTLRLHLKKQADTSDPLTHARSGLALSDWLEPLRQALRTALLAELDTRLQPVMGLLEALTPYTPQEQ